MRAVAILLFLSFIPASSYARGPGWKFTMFTAKDDGDTRVPFRITVGTVAPIQLFTPDQLKDRACAIQNPSPSFVLMLGTSSNFNQTDLYWTVPNSTGSFVTSNHDVLWAMYPPGAASETVRGVCEKQ